jgi:hypothetical protein
MKTRVSGLRLSGERDRVGGDAQFSCDAFSVYSAPAVRCQPLTAPMTMGHARSPKDLVVTVTNGLLSLLWR